MSPIWASRLLAAWDEQQAGFLLRREQRFDAILECLQAVAGDVFNVVDAGCGPGSLTQRILEAFPGASVIAVDSDPVHLAIGKAALDGFGARLQWIDADLRDPSWPSRIAAPVVDAVVSTTALHWLSLVELVDFYAQMGNVVRTGGVVLNGDNLPYDRTQPISQQLAERIWRADLDDAFGRRGVMTYDAWWREAEGCDELQGAVAARARRQERRAGNERERVTYAAHVFALTEARFGEVSTIWQRADDRLVMGVRSPDVPG